MSTPPRQRLGPVLAERRRARGRTRRAVAAAAGIDLSHLGRIERGLAVPSYAVLARLAEALGTDPGELVAGERGLRALDAGLGAALAGLGLGDAAVAEVLGLRPATLAALAAALRRRCGGRP